MQNYTTQMDAARKGIVTPEMEIVAKKEYRTTEEIRQLVAEGKVAIPANKHHTCLNPEGIGSMLRTKINVNLGVSRDCKDYNVEMEKVMSAVNMGAEAIMDLSSHGNKSIKLRLRVNDFDKTNSARNVWIYVQATSNTLNMETYSGIVLEKLRIVDDRVLSNGVQTNDRKLSYTFVQAQRDANTNDVYLYFKLKNNTGKHLRNVTFRNYYDWQFKDNQGNSYGNILYGTNTNYMSFSYTTDIQAGEEVSFIVQACDVAPEANKFSGNIVVEADNYVMEDDVLHFFNLGFAQGYN